MRRSEKPYDITIGAEFPAYILEIGSTGGRDISIYTDPDFCATYAYVAAGDSGYRVVNITVPTAPAVVYPDSWTTLPQYFSYRCNGINNNGLLGMTDNVVFPDGLAHRGRTYTFYKTNK